MIWKSSLSITLAAAVGSCGDGAPSTHADPRGGASDIDQSMEMPPGGCIPEPGQPCTMAGGACPAPGLPRFSTELDAAGWTRLQALAERGPVAIVLGERVEIVEGCQLPGRYHEAVAAPESPGRAWSSDRLVLLPDEPKSCGRATHFVASFAIRTDSGSGSGSGTDGEAIALPLPCPPIGSGGPPTGCIGAGLDDDARMAAAKLLWERAEPMAANYGGQDYKGSIPLLLEIAALIPGDWSYVTFTESIEFLREQQHGGCLWLSEAAFATQVFNPDYHTSIVDLSGGRIALSHESWKCESRPSLLTCFPERFEPGVGGNCW